MERIIDTHMHVGHRLEWTKKAQAVWMDTGPYVPRLFDKEEKQLAESYGDVIKEEAWGRHSYPLDPPPVRPALCLSRERRRSAGFTLKECL